MSQSPLQQSPYKMKGKNTYSIPSQSPDRYSPYNTNPFELINQQQYFQPIVNPLFPQNHFSSHNNQHYTSNGTYSHEESTNSPYQRRTTNQFHVGNASNNVSGGNERGSTGNHSNGFRNKPMFQTYDLYRNPMIESIDVDYPTMIESQTINNQSPPALYYFPTSGNPYYEVETIEKQDGNSNRDSRMDSRRGSRRDIDLSPLKVHSDKTDGEIEEIQKIQQPSEEVIEQPYIKTQSNLLDENYYDHWEFSQQQKQNHHHKSGSQENIPSHGYNQWNSSQEINKFQGLQIISRNKLESPSKPFLKNKTHTPNQSPNKPIPVQSTQAQFPVMQQKTESLQKYVTVRNSLSPEEFHDNYIVEENNRPPSRTNIDTFNHSSQYQNIHQNHEDLTETEYVRQSGAVSGYLPQQKPSQKSYIVNEDISQVKYRLDQLMSRFPIETFQTSKKQQQGQSLNNKMCTHNNVSDLSAPNLRRANSIESNSYEKVRGEGYEEECKRNPHTEGKIFISQHHEVKGGKYGSQQLLAKNYTDSKGNYSLNYSESAINSVPQIQLPKPSIASLYQHIRQQQETIENYKLIISNLQNQNLNLLNTIENQSKSKINQLNNAQSRNSLSRHYMNQQIPSQNTVHNHNQHMDSARKTSQLSDSFHKFQREDSNNNSKLRNSQSQNFQLHSNQNKPQRMKSSAKIGTCLEEKIQILESEKTQLVKKIQWLNGVVQEMMNMANNKVKTDNSVIFQSIQSNYNHSKRSRQSSGDIVRPSKNIQIQTSFIQSPSPTVVIANGSGINYKQLYEREIEEKKGMKSEIEELLELQNAYSLQFQMILKEIKEIKKNRAYYQELKREISKSREKSAKRQQYSKQKSSGGKKNEPGKVSSSMGTKIFENQVIYQLKTQNQHLLNKYLNLKQLYISQKASADRIKANRKQLDLEKEVLQPEESPESSTIYKRRANYDEISGNITKGIMMDKALDEDRNLQRKRQRPLSYGNMKMELCSQGDSRMKSMESRMKPVESRMKTVEKRKNGRIYSSSSLSQVDQNSKSRRKLAEQMIMNNNQPQQVQLRQIRDKQGVSRVTQRSIIGNGKSVISEQVREENRQKSSKEQSYSNWTNESSENMIGRYNNFIKNMKKRFGINSSIIGKQIQTNSVNSANSTNSKNA